MNSFEFNKIFAASLIALIVAMVCALVGGYIISPQVLLKKNSYIIEVVGGDSNVGEVKKEKVFDLIAAKLPSANLANGEKVFKKCTQCHSLESGKNNVGPSLFNIIGRAVASLDTFAYSSAMKEKSASKWDVESLNHFLYNPRKFVQNTKMTFLGIESDQDRVDVIAYLQKAAH